MHYRSIKENFTNYFRFAVRLSNSDCTSFFLFRYYQTIDSCQDYVKSLVIQTVALWYLHNDSRVMKIDMR